LFRIRCIGGLDALVKLDVLDLHGNLIRNITNLSHLIHLRVLNLAGNEITIVENLNGLVSLAELNLRRNKITHCDIGDLSHLQRLFLSHNLIESFDDIVSSVQCSLLSELSIDGNPLANDEDHRSIIISYLKQLNTLNQLHVTEDERKEATLVARQDEIKLNELHKQLKIIEERETLISAVRKEWEINHKTKDHVPINSYIEDEWNVVTLYGTPSLEFFKGKRPLPCVTQLTLNYMNFADVVNALPHMKDTLPSLQHLECHCLNLKTLFDLQTFANNFPPSLITLTMKKDGNPVTGHPYWMEWLESLLPSVIINGRKRNPDQANLFDPISQFFSMSDSINDDLVNNSLSLKQQSQKFACGVQKEALSRYCRKQEFEKVWPEVIKQLVKDAINKQ
jgi:leucine-rich repeat-containing protein 49